MYKVAGLIAASQQDDDDDDNNNSLVWELIFESDFQALIGARSRGSSPIVD